MDAICGEAKYSDAGHPGENPKAVAKEPAGIVLMEQNLQVLSKAFAAVGSHLLEYVFMATSVTFGNMFSMTGASLFLLFLPLLAKQVLLTNLMTDFPEMVIATDLVDAEKVNQPHRWDIGFIRRFMLVFGLLSSVFDSLTFGVLLFLLYADQHELYDRPVLQPNHAQCPIANPSNHSRKIVPLCTVLLCIPFEHRLLRYSVARADCKRCE